MQDKLGQIQWLLLTPTVSRTEETERTKEWATPWRQPAVNRLAQQRNLVVLEVAPRARTHQCNSRQLSYEDPDWKPPGGGCCTATRTLFPIYHTPSRWRNRDEPSVGRLRAEYNSHRPLSPGAERAPARGLVSVVSGVFCELLAGVSWGQAGSCLQSASFFLWCRRLQSDCCVRLLTFAVGAEGGASRASCHGVRPVRDRTGGNCRGRSRVCRCYRGSRCRRRRRSSTRHRQE